MEKIELAAVGARRAGAPCQEGAAYEMILDDGQQLIGKQARIFVEKFHRVSFPRQKSSTNSSDSPPIATFWFSLG